MDFKFLRKGLPQQKSPTKRKEERDKDSYNAQKKGKSDAIHIPSKETVILVDSKKEKNADNLLDQLILLQNPENIREEDEDLQPDINEEDQEEDQEDNENLFFSGNEGWKEDVTKDETEKSIIYNNDALSSFDLLNDEFSLLRQDHGVFIPSVSPNGEGCFIQNIEEDALQFLSEPIEEESVTNEQPVNLQDRPKCPETPHPTNFDAPFGTKDYKDMNDQELANELMRQLEKSGRSPCYIEDEVEWIFNDDNHKKLLDMLDPEKASKVPFFSAVVCSVLKKRNNETSPVAELLTFLKKDRLHFMDLVQKLLFKDIISLMGSSTNVQQNLINGLFSLAFPGLSQDELDKFFPKIHKFRYCCHPEEDVKYRYCEGTHCACGKKLIDGNSFFLVDPEHSISILLCREDIRQGLNQGFEKIESYQNSSKKNFSSDDCVIDDITDAALYCKLMDTEYFKNRAGLTFTLFLDEFVSFSNSTHGKAMAILGYINELPENIRYLAENTIVLGFFHSKFIADTSAFIPVIQWFQIAFFDQMDLCFAKDGELVERKMRALVICIMIDKMSAHWVVGISCPQGYSSCFTCLIKGVTDKAANGSHHVYFPLQEEDRTSRKRTEKQHIICWLLGKGKKKEDKIKGVIAFNFFFYLPGFDFFTILCNDFLHNYSLGITPYGFKTLIDSSVAKKCVNHTLPSHKKHKPTKVTMEKAGHSVTLPSLEGQKSHKCIMKGVDWLIFHLYISNFLFTLYELPEKQFEFWRFVGDYMGKSNSRFFQITISWLNEQNHKNYNYLANFHAIFNNTKVTNKIHTGLHFFTDLVRLGRPKSRNSVCGETFLAFLKEATDRSKCTMAPALQNYIEMRQRLALITTFFSQVKSCLSSMVGFSRMDKMVDLYVNKKKSFKRPGTMEVTRQNLQKVTSVKRYYNSDFSQTVKIYDFNKSQRTCDSFVFIRKGDVCVIGCVMAITKDDKCIFQEAKIKKQYPYNLIYFYLPFAETETSVKNILSKIICFPCPKGSRNFYGVKLY